MELLIAGIVLWCVVHFVPTLAKGLKDSIRERAGKNAYKGLFSLLIFASLAMIIFGWIQMEPVDLYDPPDWGVHANNALMALSNFLLVSAERPSIVRRIVRHPMLTGVTVWGIAHLLANGDQRSVMTFGALTVWAVVEIYLINARDGAWIKPEAPAMKREFIGVIITAIVFGVITYLHTLADLSPFP